MKKISLLIFGLFLFTASFGQQVDKEYKKTLKKMMEVSGSEEAFKSAIKQMVTMFKQRYPTVPSDFWNELEKEFSKTSLDQLVELLAPVYNSHLTSDDLKKIIEFYQTPVGKKYAQKTPMITQESMSAGQQWGMKIGQDIQNKLKEKGYGE